MKLKIFNEKGKTMKKTYRLLLVVLVVPFLVGMGGILGEDSADNIPTPEQKFTAIYIDQVDVTTICSNISIQGKTFIEGKKGEGTYAIHFEKIKDILFVLKGENLRGIITFYDGNKIELSLNKGHKAYGKTAHGTFQIKLLDLKKMTFTTEE